MLCSESVPGHSEWVVSANSRCIGLRADVRKSGRDRRVMSIVLGAAEGRPSTHVIFRSVFL